MARTLNAIADECGISYQKVQRYIKKNKLEDSIITNQKPYIVPEDLAIKIIEYFNQFTSDSQESTSDVLVPEPETTTNILQNEIEQLKTALAAKEEQIRISEIKIATQEAIINSKDEVLAAKDETITLLNSQLDYQKSLTASISSVNYLLGETQRNISKQAEPDNIPVEDIEIIQENEIKEPEPVRHDVPEQVKKPLTFGDLFRLWRDSRK